MSVLERQLDNIELTHKLLLSQIDNLIGKQLDDEDQKRLNGLGIIAKPVKIT